jgi:hypothetical protein
MNKEQNLNNAETQQLNIADVIRIPILSYYGGGYRLEYDGKYITLFGKDKNYKCMFGDEYEEMVLIPIVEEIRNAEPEITEITNTEIIVSLGCRQRFTYWRCCQF